MPFRARGGWQVADIAAKKSRFLAVALAYVARSGKEVDENVGKDSKAVERKQPREPKKPSSEL